jgi:hypothetical protein
MRITVSSLSSRPSNMSLRASLDLRRGPRSSLTSLRAANARLPLLSFLPLGLVGLLSLFKEEERGGITVVMGLLGEAGRVLLDRLVGRLSAKALKEAPLLLGGRTLGCGCRLKAMVGLGVAMSSSTSSRYNLALELFLPESLTSAPRAELSRA